MPCRGERRRFIRANTSSTVDLDERAAYSHASMPVRTNRLKRALASGKTVFGSSVRLPEPGLVEALGYAGFDYVLIDGEHGAIGWADMERMILAAFAASTTPLVRVLKN